MSGSKCGQWARAEAWYHLWPVLQELGIDEKCPDMSGCEAAIQFVRGLVAERDEARAALQSIATAEVIWPTRRFGYADGESYREFAARLQAKASSAIATATPEGSS